MKFGYARTSTTSQDRALQLDALHQAGCDKIFEETASGAKQDRPELMRMVDMAREGDVIVVWRLDRLARSIRHLIEIAADLRERGIDLKSLQDNIDTSTASGELHFHMLAALAQFERSLIRERVNAGLEQARKKGRLGGRPKADPAALDHARTLIAGGMSPAQAAKKAGVARSTLYRHGIVRKTSDFAGSGTNGIRTGFRTRPSDEISLDRTTG